MQRALRGLLCALFLMLGACHPAFHTSIENETDQDIYLLVWLGGNDPSGGILESGNGLDLVETIDDIRFIEYEMDDRKCRLNKPDIARIARPGIHGVVSIPLHGCSRSPSDSQR